jgi:Iron/zinc purple acid phosphatase-like protein C
MRVCLCVLCGSYERVHPVINGTVMTMPTGTPAVYQDPAATMHWVVGTSGAMQFESWVSPQPAWSAVREADWFNSYGYGQLTAHNATHLQAELSPLDNSKGDEFWIVKSKAPSH